MNQFQWLLLDTETTGLAAPVYVVELAAQRMVGWKPEGPAFRKLLNQNEDIPTESSRRHGYTREILERDGEPAHQVYREFAEYASGRPLVAFHLEYDFDQVLHPEWKRLGIGAIGSRGFCALRLAQRLLDPVPAGSVVPRSLAIPRQRSCPRHPCHGSPLAHPLRSPRFIWGGPSRRPRRRGWWRTVIRASLEELLGRLG